DCHVHHVAEDVIACGMVGGQSMPIDDGKEALVFVLQPDPVFQHTVVMAEMKTAVGSHTRDNAPLRIHGAQNGVLRPFETKQPVAQAMKGCGSPHPTRNTSGSPSTRLITVDASTPPYPPSMIRST